MSFTLRTYQNELIKKASIAVAEHKHVIAQSPGGTGKSKILITIAKNAAAKGRSVIIMTTFQKVYKQLYDECGGVKIGDGVKFVNIEEGKIYIASVQTLVKRPLIIRQFNRLSKEVLIIHDECHISSAMKIFDELTNRITIGFSATPDFRIAKHLPKIYNNIVSSYPVQWFIDNGYLCDYQHIERKSGKAVEKLEKRNGEFTEASQRKFFGTEEHYHELFSDLNQFSFNKCMLFCASIEHAEEVYARMVKEGYECSIYHSKVENSSYEIAKFEGLNISKIMISVGALAVGYDNPEVDCIVLYRATTSLAIYLQMLFRADRPKEGMFFRCFDYGSNASRHKAYFHDHPWEKMWNAKIKKKKDDTVTPMILCPQCESMIFIAARACKWCGYQIPAPPPSREMGIAEDVTNKLSTLKGKKLSELAPKELALYANLKDKKALAARVARFLEQHSEGYLKDYGKAMGYKQNWAYIQREMGGDLQFKDFII